MALVSRPLLHVSSSFPPVSSPFPDAPPRRSRLAPPSHDSLPRKRCSISSSSSSSSSSCSLLRIAVIRAVRGEGGEHDEDQHEEGLQDKLTNAAEQGQEGEASEDEDLQEKLKNSDWRSFRARLLQKSGENMIPSPTVENSVGLDLWAHPLSQPEKGCLLIANPTAFLTRQQYFHQAVIFLFAHSKEGSAGLILNRPTEYNLGQLAGFEDLLPDFASCPLYMGGDVGANALHVVHGAGGLKDTMEIIPGVYMGGLKSMKSSVQNGESNARDYRWFVRYAGWGPGQLEREVAIGVWYLASSSKDVILKHCIQLPKPLWREVLEYMGGPYVDISRRAYGET